MELKEIKKVDQIQLVENNCIQVRTATIIEKDSVEIAKTYHRHVVYPGDDITNEDSKVQAIANAIWTEEIVLAYKEQMQKLSAL
jgi:hypothetical protein